jgi:MFS family permease
MPIQKIKKIGHKTFKSLKVRNFRLYFYGQAISLCGTWMQTVALSWLVLKLTNSGTALGITTALQFLPSLLFGPFAGLIVDKFNKRTTLIITQILFAVFALVLGILTANGSINLLLVYALSLGVGLVIAVDTPTRQVFTLEMVDKEHFQNAIVLNSTQFNLARVIGPVIAGFFIATTGMTACFFLNAISFAAVLVALISMDATQLKIIKPVSETKDQILAGFKYIKESPKIFSALLMMLIIGTLTFEFSVSLPMFAKFTFNGNANNFAAMTAFMGLGSVFGGFLIASRKKSTFKIFVISAFFFGISVLLAAVAPNLTLAYIFLIFVGIASINFSTTGNIMLQMESEPQMRGRVMAFWNMAFAGSTPIGGPIIGLVGQQFSPRWSLGIGGFSALFAALLGFIFLKKRSAQAKNLRFTKTP